MLKTMYPAAPCETVFSLTVTLADTTSDSEIRTSAARALRRATPLLHAAACGLPRFCDTANHVYVGPHEVLMERTLYSRAKARLLDPARWSWRYRRGRTWHEAHQGPPRPRPEHRPRIQTTESIRERTSADVRSSRDSRLRTRPRRRHRARINCDPPHRAFDRLVTPRP